MEPWPNRRAAAAGFIGLGLGGLMGAVHPMWPAIFLAVGLWLVLSGELNIWCREQRELKWILMMLAMALLAVGVLEVPQRFIPIFDKNNVQVGLEYAYEWDNYNGSNLTDNPEDWWRVIDKPIEVAYSKHNHFEGKGKSLVLGIDNLHKRLSIRNVRLDVIFQNNDLEIISEWHTWVKNKHFFVRLGNIVPGPPSHNGNLWVKFPGPGKYEIICKIYGDEFEEIERVITIILK